MLSQSAVRSSICAGLSDHQRLLLVAGISLTLSAWGAFAQFIPNPDAMFYLRAAELFADGRWHEAAEVYRWPFYSLIIGVVVALTGAPALISAQIVNALLDMATALAFVQLVAKLAGDDRRIAFWAAFFILLHPRLIQLRPVIIRDHGFLTFFVLALYLLVLDLRSPHWLLKLGTALAIVAAGLFRLEAALLLLLVPAFYLFDRFSSAAGKITVVLGVLFISLLLVPGYTLWNFMGSYSSTSIAALLDVWSTQIEGLFRSTQALIDQFQKLLPPGRNVGGLAYMGAVVAITTDIVLRALTVPIAVLAILAFVPHRLLPGFASSFVGWFAWWQLPLLLTFMAFALFLDWRYAMAFALLAGIPAVFTLEKAAGDALAQGKLAKVLFGAAMLAIVIPFVLAFPRPSKLSYLRDAAYWIRDNVPAQARVITNDARIAYYSGRTYEREIALRPDAVIKDSLNGADYLVIHIERGRFPPGIRQEQEGQVASFAGSSDGQVFAYRLR